MSFKTRYLRLIESWTSTTRVVLLPHGYSRSHTITHVVDHFRRRKPLIGKEVLFEHRLHHGTVWHEIGFAGQSQYASVTN
jgi:hypothetical protein